MSIITIGIAIERISFIRHFDLKEAAKSLKTPEELEIELTKTSGFRVKHGMTDCGKRKISILVMA